MPIVSISVQQHGAGILLSIYLTPKQYLRTLLQTVRKGCNVQELNTTGSTNTHHLCSVHLRRFPKSMRIASECFRRIQETTARSNSWQTVDIRTFGSGWSNRESPLLRKPSSIGFSRIAINSRCYRAHMHACTPQRMRADSCHCKTSSTGKPPNELRQLQEPQTWAFVWERNSGESLDERDVPDHQHRVVKNPAKL